jgi:hypothetical protein
MTMTGAAYATTPIQSPVARFNVWPTVSTVRAGAGSLQLTSFSFTSNDNATISYFWQQLGGPIIGAFSSRTAPSPTFTAPTAGTYAIQLSACDSTGQCATPSAAQAGAVSTDPKAVVVTGLPAATDNLLGPLVIANALANPWPFGDLAEISAGTNIATTALSSTPQLGALLPGTGSWTQGSNTITTTADLTGQLAGQQWVAYAWNSADGSGTGRMLCPIQSVTATTITCTESHLEPNASGVTGYLMPPPDSNGVDFQAWTTENPQWTWNYYDVAIGLYRLYYRTGNTAYQNYARQYADITWQWTLDHGYRRTSPRAASMVSQFFRAQDGHAERFPGLYNWISLEVPLWADPSGCPSCDNRESGYMLWDIALGAKTDPDPTRHAQYCSWMSAYVPTWNSKQAADGSWPENDYLYGNYVSAPQTFTAPFLYDGAPWREAINVKSLEAAYESLTDTGSQGCNNPALAAATLTVITNAVTWQNNYGRDTTNRGTFYEVNSQSNDQLTVHHPAGTVSINLGSKTLTGSGTNWQTAGYCDGTHFIGIEGSVYAVYKIASCTSNTAATLSVAYGLYSESSNASASLYSIAPAASSSCGGSLATYCYTGAGTGDRNLTRTICSGTAWLYAQAGLSMYKNWADECYSATLGGPVTGPDSSTLIGANALSCGGPACDGFITDVVAGVPDCNAGKPAPCIPGGYVYSNLGKNFGEAFGAPGIDNELAWSLGGLAPAVNRTLWVSFSTAGVPQATHARLTLTQPSGVTVTQTCSASPCAVQADARQGNHAAQLVYLSAGGQVLASGDPMILVVQ